MTDPAVLSVLPGRLDIEFLTGNPVVVELTWLDADGDPVDVSGAATGQVLTLAGVAVVDGELDVDTTDGANGVMVVTLSAELSAELSTSHRFIIETDRCVLNGLLAPYPPGSGPPVGPVSASVVVTTEPATVTVTAAVSSTGGGGSGDVVGPASSSTGRAAEFADATGKLLREAPLTGAGGRPVLDGDGTWADSLIPASIARDTEVTSAVTAHTAAADPHGDRAYADTGLATKVPTSRAVSAGSGLTGGGDLSADRTIVADFGTGAGKVTEGNDSRLSDARTPTSHASSHASDGSDPLTLAQSQITGLTSDLALKAPLASPTLTGVPTAPTAPPGTDSTQIATTAFVLANAPSSSSGFSTTFMLMGA